MLKLSPIWRTFGRNCFALHAEVQIPVDIEVIIEIMPHERLAGEFRVHQLVEECHDLVAVHRTVEIRRHRRK